MSSCKSIISFRVGILFLIIMVNQVFCDDGDNPSKRSKCEERGNCPNGGPRPGRRSVPMSQVNNVINTLLRYHGTGNKNYPMQSNPNNLQKYLMFIRNKVNNLINGQIYEPQNRQFSLLPDYGDNSQKNYSGREKRPTKIGPRTGRAPRPVSQVKEDINPFTDDRTGDKKLLTQTPKLNRHPENNVLLKF